MQKVIIKVRYFVANFGGKDRIVICGLSQGKRCSHECCRQVFSRQTRSGLKSSKYSSSPYKAYSPILDSTDKPMEAQEYKRYEAIIGTRAMDTKGHWQQSLMRLKAGDAQTTCLAQFPRPLGSDLEPSFKGWMNVERRRERKPG